MTRLLVRFFFAAFLFGLLLVAQQTSAGSDSPAAPAPSAESKVDQEKVGTAWEGSSDLYGEVNPLGVKSATTLDYKDSYAYSRAYDMVSGYWLLGGGVGLTPAYLQPSIHFEWMPWVVATVNIEYAGYYFFGANEGLLSFSSAQQPFGDDVRRARSGTEESGWGERVMLQPAFQFKLGAVVVRNQTDYAWYHFPGQGPYFLELDYDTLLKNGDHLLANRTQILDEISRAGDRSTLAGPFFEIVHADSADLTSRRIGLLFYSEQGPQLVPRTHYFGELAYYLSDPNREHGLLLLLGVGTDFQLK